MKKLLLTVFTAAAITTLQAQVITDTVSTSATYANQVWYSLPNDEQGSAPKNNWDLAFEASSFGSTILINSITGTMLWNYPKDDTGGWSTVDTNGLSTWPSRYNSDTSWAYGAMGRYADAADAFDLDWGRYNMTTHIITGDSLYIIRLASGDYKKLWIESLSGGLYTFKYANLDGSSPQTATLDKSTYGAKNFGYYSLQTNAALDREPLSANWDLLFTQYSAFIPSAYTVTGVLANKGVEIAKCANVIGKDTFSAWESQTFHTAMNTIGYNWKTFTTSFIIQDSLVYFVARTDGEIWKMIFTGFGGSSSGSYMFSKEKMSSSASVNNIGAAGVSSTLYPNPSAGQAVNLVYNFTGNASLAKVTISDVTGRAIYTATLDNNKGLHQHIIPTHDMQAGMYVVTISTDNAATLLKLIIQ